MVFPATGYFANAILTRAASVVTAACIEVEKSQFLKVVGFDAKNLGAAYNDADVCLRLIEKSTAMAGRFLPR